MSNVLVYSGPGVSSSALHHTLKTLSTLLPTLDVKTVDAKTLALDPWQQITSLVVLPGGRDLPYLSELDKPYLRGQIEYRAHRQIHQYVQQGGNFLAICAGAYYASSQCLFELGTPIQVAGERPHLGFFQGTCQGTVYPGFVYESDLGARIVQLRLHDGEKWTCHYNGGGAFMNAEKYERVEVLARYETLTLHISRPDYSNQAAAVLCHAGKGKALLFGTHPEFPLSTQKEQDLFQQEKRRLQLLTHWLITKLGLGAELPEWAKAKPAVKAEPKPLPILIASLESSLDSIISAIQQQAAKSKADPLHLPSVSEQGLIVSYKDSNDTLHSYAASAEMEKALFDICQQASYDDFAKPVVLSNKEEGAVELPVDLDSIPKYLLFYPPNSFPSPQITPYWNVAEYKSHLDHFNALVLQQSSSWNSWQPSGMARLFGSSSTPSVGIGKTMLYTQMTTSTQTMLDKNFRFLSTLPDGTTFFATQQMSGRGRGGNRWISPKGCLQFSTIFRVPMDMASKTVFLQYLSALAIVQGIRLVVGNEVGAKVRIKWPNDVYAEIPFEKEDGRVATFEHKGKRYCKMAGILVNSQFSGGKEFVLISGCGINCLNSRPTTCLAELIKIHDPKAEEVSQEKLAAAIMATFESIWSVFMRNKGDFAPFVQQYRKVWLHSDQEVTLAADAVGAKGEEEKVRIVGISSDHGLLRVVREESGITSWDDERAWGQASQDEQVIQLQPDGNSFDMLKNMVKAKV